MEECCLDLRFLLTFDAELDHSTPGVEGFDDFIFIVAGKDESAVVGEILITRSQKELYVGSGIVCFVDDDDFMSGIRGE